MDEAANELIQKMLEMPITFPENTEFSKREVIASEMMSSLLLKQEVSLYQSNKVLIEKFERIADLSVKAADKLIEALNKQP